MRNIELLRSKELKLIILVDYHMEHGSVAGTCIHVGDGVEERYVGEYREDWDPKDFESQTFKYLNIEAHNVESLKPMGFSDSKK